MSNKSNTKLLLQLTGLFKLLIENTLHVYQACTGCNVQIQCEQGCKGVQCAITMCTGLVDPAGCCQMAAAPPPPQATIVNVTPRARMTMMMLEVEMVKRR